MAGSFRQEAREVLRSCDTQLFFKIPKVDRQRLPNVNHVFLQDSQDLVVTSLTLLFLARAVKPASEELDSSSGK